MKKLIGISLCATLAAAILVAPGGAAKPAFSVTCTLGDGRPDDRHMDQRDDERTHHVARLELDPSRRKVDYGHDAWP
jgi:hypothetical protein